MGKLLLQVLVLVLAAIVVPTAAFLAPSSSSSSSLLTPPRSILDTSLSLSSDKNNNRDVFKKSRTDIRNFLTQRSIQSFVFLLNQCREDQTVRWLEKTLDFPSIDNFHGTGAFNQTKFPEWDSVFLECVDRPEEVMVIQMRQRRRQSKLSGHNAYFESLKTSSSPTNEKDETKMEDPSEPTAFSTSNYLDAMKSDTNLTASAPVSTAPKKPEITSKKLSSAGSYLDNLSRPVAAKKPWSPNASKTKNEKEQKDDEKEKKEVAAKKEETKPIRKAFSSSSFLDNLSSVTPAFSDGEEKKSKQTTETTKNPFLEEKTKEYELSIDPPALVRRMLSVREQISQEWEEDLDMLIKLNDEITESIEEYNSQNAAKNDDDGDSDEDNLKNDKKDNKSEGDNKESDLDALLKALIEDSKIDSPPPSASGETSEGNTKETANVGPKVFDRNILNLWSQTLWSPKRSSSPYRKANFDLLLLLATQESIHRVLNSYKNDKSVRPETHEWFLDFYIDNVNEYFDGHQTYARSEDFLKEMIQSPRTLIETNNDILAWIDPAVIAEDIIRERSEVILNWMEVAKTISEEHTDLRRLLFTNMVSKSFPEDESSPLPDDTIITAVDVSEIQKDEEDSASSPTEVFGAFE